MWKREIYHSTLPLVDAPTVPGIASSFWERFVGLISLAYLLILLTTAVGCHRTSESKQPVEIDKASDTKVEALPTVQTGQAAEPIASHPLPTAEATLLQFDDRSVQSGARFKHRANRTERKLMPEIMGSGVLMADFNRDGAPDLIFINGGIVGSQDRPEDCPNQMFLNDGNGNFRDVTEEWGLPSAGYGMGGTVGDFDNDGWPDVFLTTWGGGNMLLRNTSDGFVDVTSAAGIVNGSQWFTGAAFVDLDNDGWLDLYLIRYVEYDPETALPTYFHDSPVYSTPILFAGLPDQIWINQRDGTFRPGADLPDSDAEVFEGDWKGLAVGTCDLNQDGWPDIYVANDSCRNLLFVNRGADGFEEIGRFNGVAYGDSGKEQAGMGIDFADVDGDGQWDIVCTNFQGEPANLFCQSNNLFFLDRTDSRGIGAASRGRMQWGCKFFDADNDGDDDLLIANGHLYDQIESLVSGVTFGQVNSLFENDGTGRFKEVSLQAGTAFQDAQVSRGLAVGDLNNDGLIDFVIGNNDGTAQLAINTSRDPGNYLSLWLEGTASNRSAIGAHIRAQLGDRQIMREIFGGTSYLSASDFRVHFGLADAPQIDRIEIRWPSGLIQTIDNLDSNQFYYLREGETPTTYVPGKQVIPPAEE